MTMRAAAEDKLNGTLDLNDEQVLYKIAERKLDDGWEPGMWIDNAERADVHVIAMQREDALTQQDRSAESPSVPDLFYPVSKVCQRHLGS